MQDAQKRVVQLRLECERLQQRVRELAQQGQIWFSNHAVDRMDERGITDLQVERALRTGELRGAIEPGMREGEWKCKVVERIKGQREIGVVTLVIRNARLFIKTVEWEDMK